MRAVTPRTPCGAVAALDTSGANVTNAAYVQLQAAASMTSAAIGIIVTNNGAQPLLLGTGGAGVEVSTGAVIPPVCYGLFIPIQLKAGTRMSVKSLGGTQSTGVVTIMYLQ